MPLICNLEFTHALQLYNTLLAARLALIDADAELRRLSEVEMIPVRVRVEPRLLQVLAEQDTQLAAVMAKVTGGDGAAAKG